MYCLSHSTLVCFSMGPLISWKTDICSMLKEGLLLIGLSETAIKNEQLSFQCPVSLAALIKIVKNSQCSVADCEGGDAFSKLAIGGGQILCPFPFISSLTIKILLIVPKAWLVSGEVAKHQFYRRTSKDDFTLPPKGSNVMELCSLKAISKLFCSK